MSLLIVYNFFFCPHLIRFYFLPQVTQIAAYDPDLGENGQVFYKLGDGHDNKFYIDGKGNQWFKLIRLNLSSFIH